ncbi:ras GTPase-activating protein [Infundibulicybe gibba]|nr:ras GTPase-activating protein [Infundibulicybe gibba]
MERSNSASSKTPSSPGPFAYQTRLLERTSSRGGGGSLSRSNSQSSGMSILTNPTGSSSSSSTARRWTPSHRVGASLDHSRGKWDERPPDENGAEAVSRVSNSAVQYSGGKPFSPELPSSFTSLPSSQTLEHRSSTPPLSTMNHTGLQRTPTYLKRRTMPSPIIASALSPNNTGLTVEADLQSTLASTAPTTHRIHLPLSTPVSYGTNKADHVTTPTPIPGNVNVSARISRYRANTLDSTSTAEYKGAIPPATLDSVSPVVRESGTTSPSFPKPQLRPTSLYGNYPGSQSSERLPNRPPTSSTDSSAPAQSPYLYEKSSSAPNPVMAPAPYRSSYMSSKKSSTYGENLIVGRKLGRHLPRIASGDGGEDWQEERKPAERHPDRHESREARIWGITNHVGSEPRPAPDPAAAGVVDAEDVIPGRIRLKAPSAPSSPLPSARLSRGLWADTQRHLIQAYEYLCHVGEAQQWIEGCLGEELGFGVVEMEDGLQNGVVLAKLVRAFQGEHVVRRIYEAPKLGFRHSDNINYFFDFVREVGLPEGFIFELTDLYNKKNLPKVIYCIHALSHLLSRRGMAEQIGNLLGRLEFSDDQLQRTQKGLKDAGVAMPNFSNVGRELAKEINEEPEVEIETEEERRDRLLLENETSIIQFQAFARGTLSRRVQATLRGRMRLTERHTPKLQAHCKGSQSDLNPWVIVLQARARSLLARRRWRAYLHDIKASSKFATGIQAQIRGLIQRRHFSRLKAALRSTKHSISRLQSIARASIVRKSHMEIAKTFSQPQILFSIAALQAHARGKLTRNREWLRKRFLSQHDLSFANLQARARGVLVRRKMRTQMAKLEDVTHVVIRIQAAVRTFLSRKRLLSLIRGLRKATAMVVVLQARARAILARQEHRDINKALTEVKTITSVGGFQALARASIARNRHQELTRHLSFVSPDVVGVQAATRGVLVRRDYNAWRNHLHRSSSIASLLQAMLRGVLQRRSFRAKLEYFKANLSKVVKIQSLFRAKEMREQYRQLTLGRNVTVGTIKNFVHLLDDSEADFQEEVKVERLRKQVVENIRENQSLENDVNDLDVKIALVVQNVKSFEEVMKARRNGADNAAAHAARISLLAAHGDPFSSPGALDQTARTKLELYQQLFYLLQTRGEYLSRLFLRMSMDDVSEQNRRFTERVVLTLFGYGQDSREDYLLLKVFHLAIQQEIYSASSLDEITLNHPMYINVAVQYVRPKQITYTRDAFQTIIQEVINAEDLDLEADPSIIHRTRIELEELRSGTASSQPKEVTFRDALKDPATRAVYIRHLQVLQWWTEAFVNAITQSTKKMPYCMRYLARETLISLQEKFPNAPEEAYATCIGRLVYYRYINPAIITPETFDIASKTVGIASRKNLAQISRILTQITSGVEFGDDNPSYVPINDYVRKAMSQMSSWMIEVAGVADAESHFHAHEFLDATVQPKPIYISPNEIYMVHGLLSRHKDFLAPDNEDTLKIILNELGGVPNLENEELKDARDQAVTLALTNRFASVDDPHAEEKTLWVQAKRGVLAILRVQPAQDLLESLMCQPTNDDELIWEEILGAETNDGEGENPRRQPSATVPDSAYRLEDIRTLKFAAVKALAISNLLELEKQGKISRADGFQDILNAIAGDVRSKHRKRLQRQKEMESMNDALRQLAERKKYFEEQINSYHNYVETAMNTMQRGKGRVKVNTILVFPLTQNIRKKRFVLPFTKQYFHLRDLQKSGQTPQFGSFLYTAKYLYDKGILLSIDQYSPRQFDKIQLTMASNTAGVFTLLLETTLLGVTTRIASEDIRMEDLLQAKYEKRPSLSLFNGKVKVNFELFLYQINKKFYV